MTIKGSQEQFPGERATVFLRSDEAATRCMFLCGYYSRAVIIIIFFSIGKPTDINDCWIRYLCRYVAFKILAFHIIEHAPSLLCII